MIRSLNHFGTDINAFTGQEVWSNVEKKLASTSGNIKVPVTGFDFV